MIIFAVAVTEFWFLSFVQFKLGSLKYNSSYLWSQYSESASYWSLKDRQKFLIIILFYIAILEIKNNVAGKRNQWKANDDITEYHATRWKFCWLVSLPNGIQYVKSCYVAAELRWVSRTVILKWIILFRIMKVYVYFRGKILDKKWKNS